MCDFKQHLPLLERGLRKVKEKTGAVWSPKHIIEMCNTHRAFLFVVDEGFFILRPLHCPYTKQLSVECVAAYSDQPASDESLILKYIPVMEQRAREIGATRLVWDSPRRGYERIPEIEISTVRYEKGISNE